MKLGFILSLAYLMLSCASYQNGTNSNQSNDFYLEIKQTVSGASKQHTFVFTKNELLIFENSISKNGLAERKKIYSKKIKNSEKVGDIERKAEKLEGLKAEYINAQLGGLRWEIDFIKGDTNKKVVVENATVTEVQILFETINTIIPDNKPQLHKN
ncbi:MAG TPA: hypothetical protein DDX92_11480 [Flavobacteriales bacterium]|jgi:hypothetical protein|nr:hypothetical protein [Flavobacteriales bacterium]